MREYIFKIPNTKIKNYNVFAIIIIIINMVIFGWFLLNNPDIIEEKWAVIGISVPIFFLILEKFIIKKIDTPFAIQTSLYFITFCWFFRGNIITGIILSILLFLYLISKRNLIVVINEQNVIYPSFPVKKIGWYSLNNAILKDGLLTIDAKNNKIFQLPVDEKLNPVNESEFNDFCRQQLNK